MEKWKKFLLKLTLKQQIILKDLIDKILLNNLEWLDIKKLSWKQDLYRCRNWQLRIIFYKENDKNYIYDIDFRWRIYKWL